MNALLEILQRWDASLFFWINQGWSSGFLDALLPVLRERLVWAPFYIFILVFSLLNYGKKGWLYIGVLLLCFAAADFTSSQILKKQVQRLRPCNDPALVAQVQLRVPCGSGYSFTSSHAANHFAVALFLIGVFGHLNRWIRPSLLLWAGSIALSQVYVGVHYPGDVLCGGLLGSLIGWGGGLLSHRLDGHPEWKKAG
jgi:undecaprenyl-diphosphatase